MRTVYSLILVVNVLTLMFSCASFTAGSDRLGAPHDATYKAALIIGYPVRAILE